MPLERWTGAYRSVSERPMSAEELAQLRAAKPRIGVAALAIGYALATGAVAGTVVGATGGGFDLGAALFGFAISVFVLPMTLLLARNGETRFRLDTLDADYGRIERFERQPMPEPDRPDAPAADAWNSDWFEILPRSGRVLHRSGDEPIPGRRVWVSTVATTSPFVQELYPRRLEPMMANDGSIAKTRPLGMLEIEEVRRLARRIAGSSALSAWISTVFAVVVSVQILAHNADALTYLLGAYFTARAAISWWSRWRRTSLAVRLEADVNNGFVTLIDSNSDPRINRSLSSSRLEILPRSQRLWTVDGRVADWRKRI